MSDFQPSPFASAPAPHLLPEERTAIARLAAALPHLRPAVAPDLASVAVDWRWLTQDDAAVRPSVTLSPSAVRRVLARAASDCPPAADLIVCLVRALCEARGVRDAVLDRFVLLDQSERAARAELARTPSSQAA